MRNDPASKHQSREETMKNQWRNMLRTAAVATALSMYFAAPAVRAGKSGKCKDCGYCVIGNPPVEVPCCQAKPTGSNFCAVDGQFCSEWGGSCGGT